MKCDEYQPLLDELVDGDLDAATAEGVTAHVATCAACAREVELRRREAELFARYDRGFDVSPELWAGVASRLEAERVGKVVPIAGRTSWSQRRTLFGAIAASLLVAALAASFALVRDRERSEPDRASTPRTAPEVAPPTGEVAAPAANDIGEIVAPPSGAVSATSGPVRTRRRAPRTTTPRVDRGTTTGAPLVAVQNAEREYRRAIEILSRDADESRLHLAPELRVRVDETLATLDRNIQGTRAAAYENPRDPIAAQFLMSAYQQKVDTLQDIASLASRNFE
jgi:hypothetical protein